MKKTILSAIILASASLAASAQGPYLRLGTGYAFGMASGTTYQRTNNSEEAINYSYGKGINSQIGVGVMFSEHIGVELAVGYLKGLKTTIEDTGTNFKSTEESHANMISINPSVVLRTGSEGVLGYSRFGFIAGTVKGIGTYKETDEGLISEFEVEEKGGLSAGLTAALGVQFPLSGNLGFYVEANLMQMAWSPKEGSLTKAIYEGQDVLGSLDADFKNFEYVDNITYDAFGGTGNKRLAEKRPMSNAGISLGIMFNF